VSLERKLKIALDESRLLILGAQVLFGFQFNGIFQELFEELPRPSQWLACAGLAVILLMAPASLRRISFGGEDDPEFVKIGSAFVVAARFR